jgi:anti-anti-sigma regulatory factor
MKSPTTSVVAEPSFTVTGDRHAAHVLYLAGELDTAGAAVLDAVAMSALADSSVGLVLDVAAVTSLGAAGIASFNRLGAAARASGATITIRTPDSHLDAELTARPFGDGVRTEITEPLVARQAAAPKPAPATPVAVPSAGVARRSGRGFVESFGEGRTCATPGCTTRLSQYNAGMVCGLHDQSRAGH